MSNYNGLTRNQWPGTWSPSSNHPIALDTELRGGLRYVSGVDSDTVTNITGQRLQDGMIVYVKNAHGTFEGDRYYKYCLGVGESRDSATGSLPNAASNWKQFMLEAAVDSAEVIALIDSDYVQARQKDSAGTATLALNAQKLNAQDASFYLDYNNLANAPSVLDTVDVSNIITSDVDSAFINALPNINADKLDGLDAQFFIDKIDSNVSSFDSVQGNFHVTGDLDVSGNVDLLSHPVPAFRRGRLFYDSDHHTLAYFSDVEGVVHQLGIEEHQRVFNNSGSTIPRGAPLYFSGNHGDSNNLHVPTVGLADATDTEKYNAQGLSAEIIPNQTFGYIITAGKLDRVNTGDLTAGQQFFVGLTPGAKQNASPLYPNYPMCMGWVVKASDTGDSNGVLLLSKQSHSVASFRVETSAHVGQNLQVDGNLTVLGTQTAVSTADVTAGAPFFRLNEGNAIGEAGTTYQGTGVDDAFFAGFMKGPTAQTYYVRIDGKGTGPGGVDTFEVAFGNDSNFTSPHLTKVPINTENQMIHSIDNISVKFASTTGHDSGDRWSGVAAPINIDTGFWTNRNTGASGVGFTYMGLWYDVSDDKWKLVEEYDSDPQGSINVADSSFVLGTLAARVFEGNLSGGVTGTVSDISNHTTTGLPEGNNLYYTTARHDSDTLVQVDSAYVQLRLGDLVDSADVIQLVDSSYVQARMGNLLDSVDAIQLIDSAHVQARLGDLVDSADVIQIVDSSYVVARASGAIAGSNDFLRKAGGGTIVGDLRVEDSSGNAKLILDSNFALYRSEAPGLGVGLVSHADGINIGGTLNGHLIPSGAGTFALTSQIIDSATIQSLAQEVNIDSSEVLDIISSGISTSSINNLEGIEFSYDSGDIQTTWDVTVSNKDSSHRYLGEGSTMGYVINGKFAPFLELVPGTTVRFRQDDNSNSGHPIRFYLDAAKTISYTTGVTNSGVNAGTNGSYVDLDVTDSTPTVLHYQCQNHGYMGNSLQTNANAVNTPYAATIRDNLTVSKSISGYDDLRAPHSDTTKVYTVTVDSKDATHRYDGVGSGNGYRIDGVFSPYLTLTPGRTYRFEQSNSSNNGHPIVFYKEASKATEYSTGVTYYADGVQASSSAYNTAFNSATVKYTEITVSDTTPTVLHYQCYNHGYMGNAVFMLTDIVVPSTDSATVIQLIDSDYVQARQTAGTDSAATIALINATVDSDRVALLQSASSKGTITHNKFHFTSGSGQTYFFGADSASTTMTIADQNNIEVYVDGLTQRLGKDFNVDSNSITFTYGVSNGASVSVTELVGRSDVKSTLVETTFEFDADSGQTVFTGADADGVILDMASGVVQVFLNGFLLSAENDYTLSTDTITLFDSADSGDLLAISVLDANVSSSLNTKQHIFENVTGTILKRGGFEFAGNIQVFKNGDILKENIDYTTQGGNRVDLTVAAVGSDVFVISTFAAQDYNAKTFDFVATANQTTFTGEDRRGEELKYTASGINVFLNGIALVDSSDYTAQNGVSLIMSTPVDSGDEIKITTFVPSTMASIAVPLSRTAFEFTATPNQTLFSGTDDNANVLAYEANKVDVHLNGLLLKSNDFTATNGTSVSLTEAADSGDILTVTKFVGNNIGVDSSQVQTIIDNDVRHNWSVWNDSGELTLNSQNIVNSSAKAIQLTLPFTPSQGDEIRVIDGNGTSATNNITLRRNGKNIMGTATDFVIDVDRAAIGLVYYDVGNGWILKEN